MSIPIMPSLPQLLSGENITSQLPVNMGVVMETVKSPSVGVGVILDGRRGDRDMPEDPALMWQNYEGGNFLIDSYQWPYFVQNETLDGNLYDQDKLHFDAKVYNMLITTLFLFFLLSTISLLIFLLMRKPTCFSCCREPFDVSSNVEEDADIQQQGLSTFLTESQGVVLKKRLSDSPPPYESPPDYHSLPPEVLVSARGLSGLESSSTASDGLLARVHGGGTGTSDQQQPQHPPQQHQSSRGAPHSVSGGGSTGGSRRSRLRSFVTSRSSSSLLASAAPLLSSSSSSGSSSSSSSSSSSAKPPPPPPPPATHPPSPPSPPLCGSGRLLSLTSCRPPTSTTTVNGDEILPSPPPPPPYECVVIQTTEIQTAVPTTTKGERKGLC